MRNVIHRNATVRLNNSTVVIYYSYKGKEMRYSTGVNVGPEKDKDGNFLNWDYKNKRLKIPNSKNSNKSILIKALEAKQKRIDDFLDRANRIINDAFELGIQVYPEYISHRLDKKEEIKHTAANATFFELYNQFYERKREHFSARGKIISLKDYNSTKLLLNDFEKYKRENLYIRTINNLWLEDFVNYMSKKHPKYYGDYKVNSRGEMANSTIKKRLDILTEFFSFLKDLEIVTIEQVDVIRKFKKSIKRKPILKETLDVHEIHQLYKFKFKEDSDVRIRDLFVFLCLTGIRFQDLVEFDSKFIKPSKKGEGKVYIKAASKTSLNYNIPLCKIVLEILKKYDNKLPKISGQHGNRGIKEVLKQTGLFDDLTQIKDKITGEYKMRYEAITLHKGRDSFITNLVDTTPLNELMKYTGHKKLSTLQGYIDKKRPVKMDYIKIFDIE